MHAPLRSSRSDGFNYHLNADDSQISSPSLDLSPFLQSHISFCPQNISTWVSHHLLKLNMSETKLIISPRPPLPSLPVSLALSIAPSPWAPTLSGPRWAQGSLSLPCGGWNVPFSAPTFQHRWRSAHQLHLESQKRILKEHFNVNWICFSFFIFIFFLIHPNVDK